MRYLSVLFFMLFALSCSDYPPADDFVLHFMVSSPSPVTITCYSDQLGEASFSSPGGVWTYDIPIDPPMFYQLVVRSTVAQNVDASVWIQEDYDETFMVDYATNWSVSAAAPLILSRAIPKRKTLEEASSD